MRATASESYEPPPDAGADSLIGALVDQRYAIEARVGEGGMGIVYRARHVHLGAKVAVKVLRASLSGATGAVERLRREAQAASAIGDRHIVAVRDFGRLPDGRAYFVMEHLEGLALDAVLEDGALAWERAVHVAEQVAQALSAAHEAGIVHRDLKPENVMLIAHRGDPDFVKVLDFGVAKIERAAMKITAAGTLLGTPHYMSPEQCVGAAGIDHRADIYALGVMLYEMVVGVPPFDSPDLGTMLKLQVQEAPLPPSAACALPDALEAIILRCLEKRREDRFQTMGALREALRELAGEDPPSATTARATKTTPVLEVLRAPKETPVPEVSAPPRRSALAILGAQRSDGRPRSGATHVIAAGALLGASLLVGLGVVVVAAAKTMSPSAPSPMLASEAPRAEAERIEVESIETESVESEPVEREPIDVERRDPAPSPPPITLHSEPEGAAVFAAGALLGHTPLDFPRPATEERAELTLRSEGYDARVVVVSWLSEPDLTVPLTRRARPRAVARPEPLAPAISEAAPAAPPEVTPQRRSHRELRDPWEG